MLELTGKTQFFELEADGSKSSFIAPFEIGSVYLNDIQVTPTVSFNKVIFSTPPTKFSSIGLVSKDSFVFDVVGLIPIVKEVSANATAAYQLSGSIGLSFSLDNVTFTSAITLAIGVQTVFIKLTPPVVPELLKIIATRLVVITAGNLTVQPLSDKAATVTTTAEGVEYYEV